MDRLVSNMTDEELKEKYRECWLIMKFNKEIFGSIAHEHYGHIENNPELPSWFVEMTWEDLPWNQERICINRNINTFDIVEKYPHFSWDWTRLSLQWGRLSLEYLEQHADWPWDWTVLAKHPKLTLEYLEKRASWPWDKRAITLFVKEKCSVLGRDGVYRLTPEGIQYIIDHQDMIDWDWTQFASDSLFCTSSLITPDLINKHPDATWSWSMLQSNPAIIDKSITLVKPAKEK